MPENPFSWSITASDNGSADPAVAWPEGMQPGAVNNSARGVMAGFARYIADTNGSITTGGGSNIYTVTSNSAHSTWTNGLMIAAKASFTNTAAATLNLNAFGQKKIRVFVAGAEADVAAGQIISGCTYQFRYDSALDSASGAFLLLNPSPDPTLILTPGTIKLWPSDTLETGWLWCNGATPLIASYPALYAKIGTTYGGDGLTTFGLPNYKGRSPFGSGDMGATTDVALITSVVSGFDGAALGATGGAQSIVLDTTMIPSHSHTGTTGNQSADHGHTGTTDSGGSHTHPVSGGTLGGTITTGTDTLGGSSPAFQAAITIDAGGAHTHPFTTGGTSANHNHPFTTATSGGGLLHRNMPPAIIQNYEIKY